MLHIKQIMQIKSGFSFPIKFVIVYLLSCFPSGFGKIENGGRAHAIEAPELRGREETSINSLVKDLQQLKGFCYRFVSGVWVKLDRLSVKTLE